MLKTKRKQSYALLNALTGIGAGLAAVILFLWLGFPSETKVPLKTGVTFSWIYAESLGLNWRETLTAALDDLKIRHYRIPAYWNVVQPEPDKFDWTVLDYQMDEIARRDGKVLLAVGLKLPRWPECWSPDWVKKLKPNNEHAARLKYIEAVAERYKEHPALEAWQVENEAEFLFGECPLPDHQFFKKEIELMRRLDTGHPITTTDSGELATWLTVGPLVDRLGVSVYRVVRVPWGTPWRYDWIPTFWYARRALLVSPFVKNVFVSEFQMEPWITKTVQTTPLAEQFETMNIEQTHQNFWYATRMQIDEIYFWGVEWWWWLNTKQDDSRFWDAARNFFSGS